MYVMAILSDPGTVTNFIRTFLSIFDYAAYGLLKYIYVLFFNVTSAEFIGGELIYSFFNRIQLIIGVFMVFQLTMTIIKGIVNPDTFTDSKTGAGNLIKRIVISLFLLTLIIPLNISSPRNEYERQINNNGILFGTLYSLQNRILSNNTIGRLVLGTDSTNYTTDTAENYEGLKTAANRFATTILKVFYKWSDDANPENPNASCTVDSDIADVYNNDDSDPSEIIGLVNEKCTNLSNSNYVFSLEFPFISAIVGFIFVYIMIKMTFEVAVRAVKIAMLRLIAPIPIISYMDPKGGKDGAFSSWVKTLSSTYLDLFIHLVVIYFVMFVIKGMVDDGGNVHAMVSSGFLGGLTFVIIWIGLFIFAKDAPKFFKQALGIKDNGGKFFSAFGQAMGLGAAVGGIAGSVATNARASWAENKERHPGSAGNVGRSVLSGLAGGIGGAATGISAWGKKDATASSVLEAQRKRNAMRADHSTFQGRVLDTLAGMGTGRSLADAGNKKLEATAKVAEAVGKLKSVTEEEGIKNGGAVSTLIGGGAITIGGHTLTSFDGESWKKAFEGSSDPTFTYNGQVFNKADVKDVEVDAARKAQVQAWMDGTSVVKTGGKSYATMSTGTEKIASLIFDVDNAIVDAEDKTRSAYNATDFSTYGKTIGTANRYVSETKGGHGKEGMTQLMRNANKKNK